MGFVGEGGEGGEPATEPGDEERAEKDGIGVLALAPNGEECNEEGANHVYHERNDPAWQHGCVGCGLPNAVTKRGARSSTYCNVNKAYHFLRKTIVDWLRLLRSFTKNNRANVDKFPSAIEEPSCGWGCMAAQKVMQADGVMCAGDGGGSRGSVFQTGLPYRQESGGLKTPDY